MATAKKIAERASRAKTVEPATAAEAVRALKKRASTKTKEGMARYGIPSDKAFGVPVGQIRALGKSLGRNHQLQIRFASRRCSSSAYFSTLRRRA